MLDQKDQLEHTALVASIEKPRHAKLLDRRTCARAQIGSNERRRQAKASFRPTMFSWLKSGGSRTAQSGVCVTLSVLRSAARAQCMSECSDVPVCLWFVSSPRLCPFFACGDVLCTVSQTSDDTRLRCSCARYLTTGGRSVVDGGTSNRHGCDTH